MLTRRYVLGALGSLAAVSVFPGCGASVSHEATSPVSGSSQPVPAGPLTSASMNIATTAVGTIGPGFVGTSFEKDHIQTEQFFNASNIDYIALLNRFGPSILRLGGSSADEIVWNASGTGGVAGQVAPADVMRFAGFMKALDWKCLYAVNLGGAASGATTPALAAAEVAFVAQQLGLNLYGIEIGNEPDQYGAKGHYFSRNWSVAQFEALWEEYREAILAAAPGVVITGPASGMHPTTFTVPFGQYATNRISLLTQHYYRDPTDSSLSNLISPDATLMNDYLAPLQACSQSTGVPFRITECNSYNGGGITGVSNAYASSLWAIDFCFDCALGGASGTNFQRSAPDGYTFIDDNNGVVIGPAPEYYGMLLFALAGQGTLYQTLVNAESLNVTGYAVETASGLNVVVVNKDSSENLELTIRFPRGATSAALMEMTQLSTGAAGPDLSASSGITIQGAAVNPDGSFSPAAAYTLTPSGSQITCYVPALSAVLIQTT